MAAPRWCRFSRDDHRSFLWASSVKKRGHGGGRDEKGALEAFAATASEEQQIRVLNSVLDDLVARYGDWNLPWGEVNRLQRLTGEIRTS